MSDEYKKWAPPTDDTVLNFDWEAIFKDIPEHLPALVDILKDVPDEEIIRKMNESMERCYNGNKTEEK